MISKIKHTLKKYLFVLVAISIALGGVNVHNINSPFTKKKTSSVAIVNNQKISRMLYDNIAKKEIYLVRKKTKKSLSSKNIVMIKYRILNQLISEFLLSQYAIKQKLYIKDRDVKKIILSTKFFFVGNKFNNKLFNLLLKKSGINASEYAGMIKRRLLIQNLMRLLVKTDFILPNEEERLIYLLDQKRVVRKAIININYNPEITYQDIQKYYTAHKKSFFIPERIKVSYFILNKHNIEKSFSNKDVRSYYLNNIKKFTTNQKKYYSLIQLKNKKQTEKLFERAKKGYQFSYLVKKHSNKQFFFPKKEDNAEFFKENIIPKIINTVHLNKKGQVSKIECDFGLFLIRLNKIVPKKVKPLKSVYTSILDTIVKNRISRLNLGLRKRIHVEKKNYNKKFSISEDFSEYEIKTTKWFSYKKLPKNIDYQLVSDALFKKNTRHYPIVREDIRNGYPVLIKINNFLVFVLKIESYQLKDLKSLKNIKKKIHISIKRKRINNRIKLLKKRILQEFNIKNHKQEKQIMKNNGLNFEPPKTLIRKRNSLINRVVFSMPHPSLGKSKYSFGKDKNGNVFLLSLDKILTSKITSKDKIYIQYISLEKSKEDFDSLILFLKKRAYINIHKNL